MAWGTSFVLVGKHTNKRVFPRQNVSHDLFQYACSVSNSQLNCELDQNS